MGGDEVGKEEGLLLLRLLYERLNECCYPASVGPCLSRPITPWSGASLPSGSSAGSQCELCPNL